MELKTIAKKQTKKVILFNFKKKKKSVTDLIWRKLVSPRLAKTFA